MRVGEVGMALIELAAAADRRLPIHHPPPAQREHADNAAEGGDLLSALQPSTCSTAE